MKTQTWNRVWFIGMVIVAFIACWQIVAHAQEAEQPVAPPPAEEVALPAQEQPTTEETVPPAGEKPWLSDEQMKKITRGLAEFLFGCELEKEWLALVDVETLRANERVQAALAELKTDIDAIDTRLLIESGVVGVWIKARHPNDTNWTKDEEALVEWSNALLEATPTNRLRYRLREYEMLDLAGESAKREVFLPTDLLLSGDAPISPIFLGEPEFSFPPDRSMARIVKRTAQLRIFLEEAMEKWRADEGAFSLAVQDLFGLQETRKRIEKSMGVVIVPSSEQAPVQENTAKEEASSVEQEAPK